MCSSWLPSAPGPPCGAEVARGERRPTPAGPRGPGVSGGPHGKWHSLMLSCLSFGKCGKKKKTNEMIKGALIYLLLARTGDFFDSPVTVGRLISFGISMERGSPKGNRPFSNVFQTLKTKKTFGKSIDRKKN